MSNYPLKIIHSFNLVNTFYDLFRHICMSPDSPDSHMKRASLFGEQSFLPSTWVFGGSLVVPGVVVENHCLKVSLNLFLVSLFWINPIDENQLTLA